MPEPQPLLSLPPSPHLRLAVPCSALSKVDPRALERMIGKDESPGSGLKQWLRGKANGPRVTSPRRDSCVREINWHGDRRRIMTTSTKGTAVATDAASGIGAINTDRFAPRSTTAAETIVIDSIP